MVNECYVMSVATILILSCGQSSSSQPKILLTHNNNHSPAAALDVGDEDGKEESKIYNKLVFYLGHKDEDLCCFLHLKG